VMRRHKAEEIVAKLRHVEGLAATGRPNDGAYDGADGERGGAADGRGAATDGWRRLEP